MSGADLGGVLWLLPVATVIILAAFFIFNTKNRIPLFQGIALGAAVMAVAALVWKLADIISAPKPAFGLIKPHDVGFRLGIGGIGTMLGLVGAILGCRRKQPHKKPPAA